MTVAARWLARDGWKVYEYRGDNEKCTYDKNDNEENFYQYFLVLTLLELDGYKSLDEGNMAAHRQGRPVVYGIQDCYQCALMVKSPIAL